MGCGEYNIKIEDETLKKLASIANGDVRTALNGLEVAVLTTAMDENGYINITSSVATNYYINCYSTIKESDNLFYTELYPY